MHHGVAKRPIPHYQLEVHLCFTLKPGHALSESAAVGPHRLAQRIIAVEDGSEAEGQHGSGSEAQAYHPGMFQDRLLFQLAAVALVFADHYGELAVGIAEYRRAVHSLDTIQHEGAPGTCSISEGLLLSEAIRVPRHIHSPNLSRGMRSPRT